MGTRLYRAPVTEKHAIFSKDYIIIYYPCTNSNRSLPILFACFSHAPPPASWESCQALHCASMYVYGCEGVRFAIIIFIFYTFTICVITLRSFDISSPCWIEEKI